MKFINDKIINETHAKVDEIYAYMFGSVGFVKCKTKDAMQTFLGDIGNKQRPKVGDKQVWASASKTPEERKKCKTLSKYKRVLIEVGLAKSEEVRVDYTRGFLMIKRMQVGIWHPEGRLDVRAEKLAEAGIEVPVKKLEDAVKEMMAVE